MLRTNKFLTLLVLVALLVSACQPIVTPESMEIGMAGSTELDVALADETVAAIRQIVEERMAQVQAPGFAVAVVRDGTMVYAEGFGVAELGTARPVTPQTVFQLASTSKPITAIAIMQLAEAGKLQLDSPITEYLPYFQLADERYRDITIEQILTHRSGLPEGGGFLGAEAEIVPEFDEEAAEHYVRGLADLELLFAPGTDWAYSDMGYNILGDVIAKVSGLSFEAYAQQNIFTPLGMAQTTFLLTEVPTMTLALPHVLDENGEMASTGIQPYTRPLAPSDTLFSSVIDMSSLAIASLNHGELDGVRILSAESWQQMWTVQTETWFGDLLDYLAPEYAYGWYWGDVAGQPVVHHPGTELGYQNIFLLAPEENLAVITMGNALASDEDFFYAMAIGQEVLKALLGAQPTETAATELPVPRFEPSECKYPVLADTDAEVIDFYPYDRIHGPSDTLYTSVVDLSRMAMPHLNRGTLDDLQILPAAAYDEMWTPLSETGWAEWFGPTWTSYGLGWLMGEDGGHMVYNHTGADSGYQSHILVVPDADLAIVAMVNVFDRDEGSFHAYALADEVMKMLLGMESE